MSQRISMRPEQFVNWCLVAFGIGLFVGATMGVLLS